MGASRDQQRGPFVGERSYGAVRSKPQSPHRPEASPRGPPARLLTKGRKAEQDALRARRAMEHDRKSGECRSTSCAWRTPGKEARHSETTSPHPDHRVNCPMRCWRREKRPHEVNCLAEGSCVSKYTHALQVSRSLTVHLPPPELVGPSRGTGLVAQPTNLKFFANFHCCVCGTDCIVLDGSFRYLLICQQQTSSLTNHICSAWERNHHSHWTVYVSFCASRSIFLSVTE